VVAADCAKILPNSYKSLNTRTQPAAGKIFKCQEVGYNVKSAFFLCMLPVLPAGKITLKTYTVGAKTMPEVTPEIISYDSAEVS